MGLRTSASSLDLAFAARPELKKYSAQIQKLDRDHNNEIELEDIAEVIADLVEAEKSRRLFYRLALAMAGLLFITVIATVGLTYAIVYLTKDSKVESGIILDKATGNPLLIGTPEMVLVYDENMASDLAMLFNGTSPEDFGIFDSLADEDTRRRQLLQMRGSDCANAKVEVLAATTFDYVKSKCVYLSKPGTDNKFALKVQRSTSRNTDCAEAGRKGKSTCATYRDSLQVVGDECDRATTTLTCRGAGQTYTVAMIWADSLVYKSKDVSYLFSCQGTCGSDGKIAWGKCGVARSWCPGTTSAGIAMSQSSKGRRLQESGIKASASLSVYGAEEDMELDCSSGTCIVKPIVA